MPPSDDLDELLLRARGYALALTHEAAAADDLVQEACLAVLRARGTWNVPYLFRAVRTRFLDSRRRPRAIVSLDDEEHPVHDEALLADEPPLPGEGAALWDAIGALRPDAREALYLACVEGFTAREIAGMTGRPRGTVLSLLHRARLELRERLAPGAATEITP